MRKGFFQKTFLELIPQIALKYALGNSEFKKNFLSRLLQDSLLYFSCQLAMNLTTSRFNAQS